MRTPTSLRRRRGARASCADAGGRKPRARGCARETLLEERIAKKNHPKLGAEPPSYSYAAGKGRREGAPGQAESSSSSEACGSGKAARGPPGARAVRERETGQGRERRCRPGPAGGEGAPQAEPGGRRSERPDKRSGLNATGSKESGSQRSRRKKEQGAGLGAHSGPGSGVPGPRAKEAQRRPPHGAAASQRTKPGQSEECQSLGTGSRRRGRSLSWVPRKDTPPPTPELLLKHRGTARKCFLRAEHN